MPIKNILVALAGMTPSMTTLKYALYLSKTLGAFLTVMHVINRNVLQDLLRSRVLVASEAREFDTDLEVQGRLFLERVKRMVEAKGLACETMLVSGTIATEIANAAAALKADLLVVGEMKPCHSRKDIFVSEGSNIMHSAPCPVVVAKNAQEIDKLFKEIGT
jgi:nucleotide-binding universal stress UspA family protein